MHNLKQLKTWQLLSILVLSLFLSATLLRLNNIGMIERRQTVVAADKAGDAQQTRQALLNLQQYVSAHMNTDLREGVYLEQAYLKDREAALQGASQGTNPSSVAYQQASVECRNRFQGGTASFRNDYVQCVIDRVGTLTQAPDPTAGINLPKVDMYRYNFASPTWSPDLAGFSVLFNLLLLIAIVVRLALLVIIKILLKRRYVRING